MHMLSPFDANFSGGSPLVVEAGISCFGLRKNYGDQEVVHGVDLTVHKGEFVVLLGASGSGKSTILRMIAGLEDITSGDMLIEGRRVNDLAPRDRDIAMVFQSYALYPHMTVYENIAFGLKRLKLDRTEVDRRIREVTTLLDLEPYLKRRPLQLSGGQQQRVAIARAISKTPAVFLFDEPLSNLDAKLRHHMRVEIARLHTKLKATTVYVTHDQLEAMTLADRIVLLRGGAVEQIGTPVEIFERPCNRYVAGFVGTPPINFLPGEVGDNGAVRAGGVVIRPAPAMFELGGNRQVVVGIRPTHLSIAAAGEQARFTGRVAFVEYLGGEALLTVTLPEGEVGVQVPSAGIVPVGEMVNLAFDDAQLHLFGGEGERSLRLAEKGTGHAG
jgi:multiple sugar transport system ATP-binding protein